MSVNENCCMISTFTGVSNAYIFTPPVFSNGNDYCRVSDSLYILANGNCIDSNYICTADALLEYKSAGCQGNYSVLDLEIVKYNPKPILWTNIQPPSTYKLQYKTAVEIISFIGTLVSIVGSLIGLGYFTLKYLKTRSSLSLVYAISNFIWSGSNIICMMLLNISGIDGDLKWKVLGVEKLFFDIATLSSTIIKAQSLGTIFDLTNWMYILLLAVIFVVHFGLLLGNYVMFFVSTSSAPSSIIYEMAKYTSRNFKSRNIPKEQNRIGTVNHSPLGEPVSPNDAVTISTLKHQDTITKKSNREA
ncbi:hypothetical protein HDV04_003044 [Boothiomyces sp. JEL0838]|nr:hypothetical protein HDV04_003044 [Boothiomyces sp. JEL0838]